MTEIPPRLSAALADRYRIQQELGSGGMATVYLADDLKHDRKVAIKVLRPELAAVIGGERFVAEIKTTAALQHPHILPLFDSGEADTFLYYVMPYVEGESLREKLDREGQLPVDEAVRVARAIGSALHYAHERGIVHRDIKPANILMHAGEPVVADFGIAIAISAAGGGRLTETGMSVGTPHYMSPEQASADRDVDARSDTYALACVLYEMLAGAPPHTGPTAQAVLMRILTESPRSITDLRKSVPPHVRDALARGLEKLPADRFASAKEFVDALGDGAFRYQPVVVDATAEMLPAVRRPATAGGGVRPWMVLVAALFGMVSGGVLFRGGGEEAGPAAPATRLLFDLEGLTLEIPEIIHVSPDGDQFAFVGDRGALDGIFTRDADEVAFRHMAGTEEARFMAFSPDGDWIAFVDNAQAIQRIPAGGGSARTILPPGGGAARLFLNWDRDGHLIFVRFNGSDPTRVIRVPDGGGEPEELMEYAGGILLGPQMLPDGRTLLVSAGDASEVLLHDVEADSTRVFLSEATWARLLPGGEMIYVDIRGGLWAGDFDLGRLAFRSDPVPVMEGVYLGGGIAPALSVSDGGMLAYQQGVSGTGMERLVIVDFEGGQTDVPIPPRRYRNVRWSPDGTSVAFSALAPGERTGQTSIYTYNVDLRTATRRLTSQGTQAFPVWSPDGRRIAFLDAQSTVGGDGGGLGAIATGDLFVVDAEGGEPVRLLEQEGQDVPYDFTRDGLVLYAGGTDTGTSDLLLADADRPGEGRTYLDTDGDLGSASVSPDGRWVAFYSSEQRGGQGGPAEIVVRSYPDAGPPIPVSRGGGDRPRWSRAGDRIFYWKTAGDLDSLMVARVRSAPSFEVLSTELVLTGRYWEATWDLHPDGDRMVIAMEVNGDGAAEGNGAPVPIGVVNWFTELRAALGVER